MFIILGIIQAMFTRKLPDTHIDSPLPPHIMTRASRGIGYISHPVRLRILEYLDVYGMSSVSAIARALDTEQMIVSQHLRKMRDTNLVRTHRRGIFVYYEINEEYPASIFVCLRKLYGYMTNQLRFIKATRPEILPTDYTTMAANRIKLFSHIDKMRILEYIMWRGGACVGDIASGTHLSPMKTSQYLKKLSDDGFVSSNRDGRYVFYSITPGVHQTAIGCIHKRFARVGDAF